MTNGLDGKVAIITRREMGIRESIVWHFTKHVSKVIISYLEDEVDKNLVESLSPSRTFFSRKNTSLCYSNRIKRHLLHSIHD